MAKIQINNPRQIINGGAKKYYFKVKGLGGPKGDRGDKGDTGSRGPQGEPGNAATVYVGSTTTLEVGQDATVENVGTQYNAVLNFGIPQGPRGPQGIQGERGEPGQTGQTGPRGPQGEKGTNATVYVGTTTTTNPGTQARVYNSGTDSNAVLNFEIPRGDVGPSVPLVQETGNSTTKAMSQNATTEALNGKQNTLTAGSNITISGNTISAKDTTYTAGDNVQINGTVISATDTTYTAGANIQIENDVVSATDTTYTAGNGLNLNGTEFSADTDVLATKEDLEDYYTKPETDNLLAPKLEAEVVAELPTTGAEGKLYLTPKAHTTQTATGNPITATVAEEAGAIESFQLDGDTYQQTYTGKNLLNSLTFVKGRLDDGVVGYQDGTSVLEATATDITFTTIANFRGITSDYVPVVGGSQYIQNQQLTFDNNTGGAIAQYDSTKTFIQQDNITTGSVLTMQATTAYIRIYYFARNAGTITLHEPQLELGSTATSYEPFVGGQPSPSPEYPQPIQTVTGEQTVEIVGKNKYPFNDTAWTSTATSTAWCYQDGSTGAYGATVTDSTNYKLTLPAGTYTVTGYNLSDNLVRAQVVSNGESGETIWANGIQSNQLTQSFTLTEAATLCVRYRVTNPSLGIGNTKIQIELGSTATVYAPYSKQTLPLDLGGIQLCGLGDDGNGNPLYKDYIYPDGEEWKIHKATKKVLLDSSEGWTYAGQTNVYYSARITGYALSDNVPFLDCLKGIDNVSGAAGMSASADNSIAFIGSTAATRLYIKSSTLGGDATGANLRAWLSTHNVSLYYALATATDTTITDTNLIAQLEAIRTASLQNGANTITNTATGSNLAGDMEIGYYGFAPRNRYDKWLWLDINNEYEQIGS